MRKLTRYAEDSDLVKTLLEKLSNRSTNERDYAESFYKLGAELATAIQQGQDFSGAKVILACSSEDADWLSRGILDNLIRHDARISLAVFWNLRIDPFGNKDLPVAPIVKSYIEPMEGARYLIICKSIISTSCVVRTNLTSLIEKINPDKIFIAAPVLLSKAIPTLKCEFHSAISEKFEFFYFAEDDQVNDANEVIPGIGGSIYNRLGLGDSTAKNKYIPNIVKERRAPNAS